MLSGADLMQGMKGGGDIVASLFFAALIALLGVIPMTLTDTYVVEYRGLLEHSGASTSAIRDGHGIHGEGVSCHIAPLDRSNGRNSFRCDVLETDDSWMTRLESLLEAKGWRLYGEFEMTSAAVPEPTLVAAVVLGYVAVAIWLVNRTRDGWLKVGAPSALWRHAPALAVPVASSFALGWIAAATGLAEPGPTALPPQSPALDRGWLALSMALPIMAAVPEEALFRGWLHQRLFDRFGPWIAALIIAELFVLAHIGLVAAVASGVAASGVAFVNIAQIFVMSLALTWVRYRSGSVLMCVVAHALNNGVATAILM